MRTHEWQELRAEVERQAGELDELRDDLAASKRAWNDAHSVLDGVPPANADEAQIFALIRAKQADDPTLSLADATRVVFRERPGAYDAYRLAATAPNDRPERRATPPFDPPFTDAPASQRFLAVIRDEMRRSGLTFDQAFAVAAKQHPRAYDAYRQTTGTPVSE
jgi:hypothetical protein